MPEALDPLLERRELDGQIEVEFIVVDHEQGTPARAVALLSLVACLLFRGLSTSLARSSLAACFASSIGFDVDFPDSPDVAPASGFALMSSRCRTSRALELDHDVQHREQEQARDEKQPRGADVAAATAREVFAGQEARPEQQRAERPPQAAVECDVASGGLAQELRELRQPRLRLLPARGAIRAGRGRAAVAARAVDLNAGRRVDGQVRRHEGKGLSDSRRSHKARDHSPLAPPSPAAPRSPRHRLVAAVRDELIDAREDAAQDVHLFTLESRRGRTSAAAAAAGASASRDRECASRRASARRARGAPRSRPAVAGANFGARHTAPPVAATRSSYAATCTAAARLSDAYSGFAGIVATSAQRASSSFERPDISLPKTSATSPRGACRDRLLRGVAEGEHAPREFARPGREADRQRGARERVVQRRHDAGALEERRGPRCARIGFRIGKAARRDQHELREPHRVHRARRRADIAGMAGATSTMRMRESGSRPSVTRSRRGESGEAVQYPLSLFRRGRRVRSSSDARTTRSCIPCSRPR